VEMIKAFVSIGIELTMTKYHREERKGSKEEEGKDETKE